MGCIDELEAAFLAYKYIEQMGIDDIPDIFTQSYTAVTKLGHRVNLHKLSMCKDTRYFPELFAAVRMTNYNPISVNVFSTGSVVVCGLKEPAHIYDIINNVKLLVKNL